MTTQSPVGRLVCVNPGCQVAGYPTTREKCVSCGTSTHSTDEPGLAIPTPKPQGPSQLQKVETGMEVGSRVFYGGFWVVVAVVAVIAGFLLFSNGAAGAGLLAFVVAVAGSFYARYIFRGGRFRIRFW